ncbi:MAG: methyltransferase domain-containing protein [Gemmatimonadales bacterium]
MSATLLAAHGDELLDHPDADPAAVRLSLHHIARANWWFGGWWAVRHGLATLLGGAPRGALTVLDVGCGGGDLMARAAAWGRARGHLLRPVGLERHRAAAALARQGGLPSLLACAGALPLRARSVDLVVASQLLHHFAPPAIIEFCRAADRVARIGVVIADLRRSRLAQAGFWVGSRALGFDAATRADGITSVQRGFTADGLRGLLAEAGLAARVERTPGFRLVATWPAARG